MKVMTGNKLAKQFTLFFSQNQLAYGRKMARKMKKIRGRLADIANVNLQLFELLSRRNVLDPPVVNMSCMLGRACVGWRSIVGREREMQILISFLLDANVADGVSVIPIVGIGGQGKTALARHVYNDKAVREKFDEKMFVSVSEKCGEGQIAVEQMLQVVRIKIEGKKFFLVLDDVWDMSRCVWVDFSDLLMAGAKGSKVIVTTRSKKVAEVVRTHDPIFLEGLNEDNSWQLFSREAGKEPEDAHLRTFGKDIVKKCFGLPLAIKLVGSLFHEKSVDDWLYLKDTELSMVSEGRQIFNVLKPSYDDFGSYLEQCFAYCSLFPKDFVFEREYLVQLWMAQGLIPESGGTGRPEDVGDEYVTSLLSRCFFQDVSRGDGTCKMPGLIHELAVQVAKNECVTICSQGEIENIGCGLRHLLIDSGLELPNMELQSSLIKAKRLRTFLMRPFIATGTSFQAGCSGEVKPLLSSYVLSSLTSRLECVRVLGFRNSGLTTIPKCIGNLLHLRYLDLSYNAALKKLPQSITMLCNLQTLTLSGCVMLEELPRSINKLVSLRHVELDGCNSLRWMPQGLGQLTCLQTLTRFVLGQQRRGCARLSDLSELSNLRGKFRIEGLRHLHGNTADVESAKVFLERQSFQELQLCWAYFASEDEMIIRDDEMILRGGKLCHTLQCLSLDNFCGKSLSICFENFSSLEELSIRSCNDLTSLPDSFGNLSSLKMLSIESCIGLLSLPESFGNLSSLGILSIKSCNGLVSLPESFGNLSSLKWLEIESCSGLVSLPESFGNLSSLYWLEIESCNGLVSLPESFGNLSSLKSLEIESCNVLVLLPVSFGNLSSLRSLAIVSFNGSVSFNGLVSLPVSFGNLSSLRNLIIQSCNGLVLLPESFGNLSFLEMLEIKSCNGLVSLPESFGNLSSLRTLVILSCSGLVSLPESFGNLSSLGWLGIVSCNGLASLPESLGNLSSLGWLGIESCNAESLGNLSSLGSLSIVSCNGLVSLPESFRNLSSLRWLVLVFCNGLASLPESIVNVSSLKGFLIKSFNGLASLLESCNGLANLPVPLDKLSLFVWIYTESCNGLANLSSLNGIYKESCIGLATLPESYGNLSLLVYVFTEVCNPLLGRTTAIN